MTTLSYQGREIELAKYTVDIAERIDDVGNERDFRKKAEDMYALMAEIIGTDFEEIVQGDSYETCDLTILVDLFNESNHAYETAIRRFDIEREDEQKRQIDKLANQAALFQKAIDNARNTPGK